MLSFFLALTVGGDAGRLDNGNNIEVQLLAQQGAMDGDDSSSSSSSEDERAVELDSDYGEEEDEDDGGANAEARKDNVDRWPAPVEKPMDIDDDDDENTGTSRNRKEEGEEEAEETIVSSIEGLKGLRHKLNFLGLVGMDECEGQHVPAIRVSTSNFI